MTERNDAALAESEIDDAVAFADAAQYLAGGRTDERSRELGREVPRGNLTHRKAVDEYLAEDKGRDSRAVYAGPLHLPGL